MAAAGATAFGANGINSEYGQLIVLGYKQHREVGQDSWAPIGERNIKYPLRRRQRANGICRSPEGTNTITFENLPNVMVKYAVDDSKDMFQLGRLGTKINDFVIQGPLHSENGPNNQSFLCGPVSRRACRLIASRFHPFDVRIFAGGFNDRAEIPISSGMIRWRLQRGEIAADEIVPLHHQQKQDTLDAHWDALTSTGIRIWKPEIGKWREVSVRGGVHELRPNFGEAGERHPDENSILTNGTIIDIGGVQLLFESADSMRRQDAEQANGDRLAECFNDCRPVCPLLFHALQLKCGRQGADDDSWTPYVYSACGHVVGYNSRLRNKCPMCRTIGPYVELKFEWESAICDDTPIGFVLNPCGHMVSKPAAIRWASLALPYKNPLSGPMRPICPFCAEPLNTVLPYTKIHTTKETDIGESTDTVSDSSTDG